MTAAGARAPRGRRQSIDEQRLRQDLVALVHQVVAAELAQLRAPLKPVDGGSAARMALRIGEAIEEAIIDHEDRLHACAHVHCGQVAPSVAEARRSATP